eukprot:TRINITY_DN12648_c0_g1_i1.p1 TRINITY_DN12648_c0_g1~~TRINITY_DN12648_c0_g1_i1.p1  ORF type:complete len:1116 (-),score=323.34 TRINITY_DN12648_c0_g1_i1:34-2949(-)
MMASVMWEKDKPIHAIVAAACIKRGEKIDNYTMINGATKQPIENPEITLGELWTTSIIMEPINKKSKSRKSAVPEKNKRLRAALDGFIYGYVLRARGLGNKETEGVKAVIGPVSSTNEFILDNKKKKILLKTKAIKDKNPEWSSFFQFPAKPPISALKLQILVGSEVHGEVILNEMPDSMEVKKTFQIQGKKKTGGEVDVHYMYISDKSAAEGKTHPFSESSYESLATPMGQFSGYILKGRNLTCQEGNSSADSYCLYGLVDDNDVFTRVNDDYSDDDDNGTLKDSKEAMNAKKSKIQFKTVNPEWNTYFNFSVQTSPHGLKIEIWDYDGVRPDAFMGQVVIKNVEEGVEVNDWFTLQPRSGQNDKVSGDVLLQFIYLSPESISSGKSPTFHAPTGKKKKAKESGPMLDCPTLEGVIAGYISRAKDLPSLGSTDLSNPYCLFGPIDANRKYCFDEELHISMKEKTEVQQKTLHPIWKTYFEYKVKAPVCAFKVEVWEWDKVGQDEFIGEFIITDFPEKSETKQWYPLHARQTSKDSAKGQVELQFTYLSAQSIAAGEDVPYDPADRKKLEKEKTERDQIDKGDFTYMKVATYEAPNYEGDFFRTKLFHENKWEDTYCVIFYDIWLIYPIASKGILPVPLTKPVGHVRLDRFNYKTIKQIENRVVSSGLIPKNERYINTFAIGVGEKECLVECQSLEDMNKWMEKVTNHVKNLLRARKFFQTKSGEDILAHARTVLPFQNPPVKPPLAADQEERWIDEMKEAFKHFNELKADIKHLSLFYRYNSPKSRDYINWWITPPQDITHTSLERAMQEQEEKYLISTWKNSFTNFDKMKEKLQTLPTSTLLQKEELSEYCTRMNQYIFYYNLYNAKIYKRKPAFAKATEAWDSIKLLIENAIKDEKAAIRAKNEEMRQARLAEIQRQRELLEKARKEYEAQLRDPFSETNMLNDNEDPFVDVVIEEMVDMYGEIVNSE